MLLDYVFEEVVIQVKEVDPLKEGFQEIVHDDEEAVLEAVTLTIL